jgi:hypothetical protein
MIRTLYAFIIIIIINIIIIIIIIIIISSLYGIRYICNLRYKGIIIHRICIPLKTVYLRSGCTVRGNGPLAARSTWPTKGSEIEQCVTSTAFIKYYRCINSRLSVIGTSYDRRIDLGGNVARQLRPIHVEAFESRVQTSQFSLADCASHSDWST